jgi:hypothetical protein
VHQDEDQGMPERQPEGIASIEGSEEKPITMEDDQPILERMQKEDKDKEQRNHATR